MKKFLFSLAAFAIALTASAQETKKAEITAAVTADTDFKYVTVTIDNKEGREGFQSNFYVPTTAELITVEGSGSLAITVLNKLKKPVNVFETKFSETSSVDNTPVFLANFNVGAKDFVEGGKPVAIENGEIYIAYFTLESKGTVKIVSVGCPDITVDLDATAAKVVAADDAVATTKTVENGQVVIVKNGKKYTAAGAQIK